MSFDIAHILDEWEHHPGQVITRRFMGKDGREKIQLRLDLGLLQMDATGRPDGKRPFGRESLLEHFKCLLGKYRAGHGGGDDGFALKNEDCARLQHEAIQYHHRCICLYQLGDYTAAVHDVERNLEVFDLVHEFARSDDMVWPMEQFRPQLMMMHVRAKGALALQQNNFKEAIVVIEKGLEEFRQFYKENDEDELAEHSGEIHALEAWLEEIHTRRPMSERERLEMALNEAIRNEDFEKAARVRDALRKFQTP